MNRKIISILILFSLLLFSCVHKNSNKNNELSNLEQKIEAYIVKRIVPQYHQSIAFQQKKEFNLNQLIADHKIPQIYSNVPKAYEENEAAFESLEEMSKNTNIAYSLNYVFEYKNEVTDPWYSSWVLILLNKDDEILGEIRYNP